METERCKLVYSKCMLVETKTLNSPNDVHAACFFKYTYYFRIGPVWSPGHPVIHKSHRNGVVSINLQSLSIMEDQLSLRLTVIQTPFTSFF